MKNNRLIYLLIIILAIWCIVLTTSIFNKEDTSNEIIKEYNVSGISTDFTKIVSEKKDSIVTINSNGTISTGFIYKQIDDATYVITSYHGVLDSANNQVIFVNGFTHNAELIGYDIYLDLAVLKVEVPYFIDGLTLCDASLVEAGEFVINIGTPSSIEFSESVELGMVSRTINTINNSIVVDKNNYNYCLDVLQISSNLRNGYSGSPVINMNGEAIGMITMLSNNGNNISIVSNEIKVVVENIINNVEYKRNNIGIIGTYINGMPLYEKSYLNLPIEVLDGLYVRSVLDNSISSIAGVKTNDVITSINGIPMNNINSLYSVIYGDYNSFEFTIIRDGETISLVANIND